MSLIPVSKNGKFLGYATKEQIENNKSLKVFNEKEIQKVPEPKQENEPEEKVNVEKTAPEGADPSKIKKRPGK